VQVVTEVLDALVGEVPVVMPPGKLLLDIASGLQGGQGFNDLKVRDGLKLRVLGGVEILLSHHHSLLEEVFIDSHTALLRHQHPEVLTSSDAGQVGHLGYQGGGGRALVLPGGWEDSLGLVVPGQPVDPALNKNKTELGILVLPVTLKMFPDGHSLLDQVVAVLWQLRGHALAFQDTEDLVASNEANLGNSMTVPEDHTNLGGGQTLLGQLEDLVLDLVGGELEPLWD